MKLATRITMFVVMLFVVLTIFATFLPMPRLRVAVSKP
jgi:preprotein translocase subunit SecG